MKTLTVRRWRRGLPGSEETTHVEGLHFEMRGKKVVLTGHTASNCDVEVEVDYATLMDMMRGYVAANKQ